jgi:transcriptional regulator with XRE-family HTH domain
MTYAELIAKALKGRSVNKAAKDLGINQVTLNRYVNGRLPDFSTALLLADEAGVEHGEAFEILALEEEKRRTKLMYNPPRADVAQLVEQLIRNQ